MALKQFRIIFLGFFVSGCSFSGSILKDFSLTPRTVVELIPGSTSPSVNSGNQSAVPISGYCPEGAKEIQLGAPLNQTLPCVNGQFNGTVNLTALPDGDYQISIIPDKGEISTWSLVKDTVPPTVGAIVIPSFSYGGNLSSFPVSGSCSESNQEVTIQYGTTMIKTPCVLGSFSANLDLSGLSDGPISISIMIKDGAGNISTAYTTTVTKDSVAPPVPIISNAPVGDSPIINLDIPISGTEISHYRYVIGPAATTDCSNASIYSAEVPVATHITDDISGFADGTMKLCVWPRDNAGNYLPIDNITPVTWVKDSSIALAVLSAYTPSGSPSNSTASRSLIVSGVSIVSYKSVIIKDALCSTADFSSSVETAVAVPITLPVGSGDGTYRVCVIGKNSLGNWQPISSPTSSADLIIDTTLPTLTLSSLAADPFNTVSFAITATFSESVADFSLGDISVTNGVALALVGGPSVYTFIVTPSGQGLVTVAVSAGVAHDGAGNYSTVATNLTRTYDSVRPTLSLASEASDPFNSATISVTATFSESVTGFSIEDISIINGAASSLSGTGATYTFTVTPSGQGPVAVAVDSDIALDAAGNSNIAATSITRIYDSIAPTITGLSNDVTWRASKNWTWGCDETCTYRFTVDTSAVTTPGGMYSATTSTTQSSGSGTYYLHVQAQDSAGNTSLVHVSALLDNLNPTPVSSIIDGVTLSSLTQSPVITFTNGTDASSGIQKHQLRVLRASDSLVVKDWHDFTSDNQVTGLSLETETSYVVEIKVIDNVSLESTIVASDGWIADTTNPGTATGLTVGSVSSSLITSPSLNWSTASDGAGSGISQYEVRVFRALDGVAMNAWTPLASGGTITGLSLSDGMQYYFRVRAVDNAGNIGSESAVSSNWSAVDCPVGYIRVPSNASLGTSDFCVAQFEMKNDGSNNPISQASGNPWVSIDANMALSKCQSLNALKGVSNKYDLISNSEWMTIARNIEGVASNWSGGSVGSGVMARGWTANATYGDSWTNTAVAPLTDASCIFNSAANTCGSTGSHLFRRTHVLSNGSTIWDFSGNTIEWVDWVAGGTFTLGPTDAGTVWREFTDTTSVGSLLTNDYLPGGGAYTSAHGAGRWRGGTGGAALRGGTWSDGYHSGVYELDLARSPTNTFSVVGFRCVFRP